MAEVRRHTFSKLEIETLAKHLQKLVDDPKKLDQSDNFLLTSLLLKLKTGHRMSLTYIHI